MTGGMQVLSVNRWIDFNETWHKYSSYKWSLLKRRSR